MRNVPAIIIGTVGSAFLAVSLLSADPGMTRALPATSVGLVPERVGEGTSPMPATLENPDFRILFGSDSVVNTNYLGNDVRQPLATLKEKRREPARETGPQRHESKDELQKKGRPRTFGCVTSVSPLARAAAEQSPSLCLAEHGQGSVQG